MSHPHIHTPLTNYLQNNQRVSYLKPLLVSLRQDARHLMELQLMMMQSDHGAKSNSRKSAKSSSALSEDSLHSLLSSLPKKKRLQCNEKILQSLGLNLMEDDDAFDAEAYMMEYLSALISWVSTESSDTKRKRKPKKVLHLNTCIVPLIKLHQKRYEMLIGCLKVLLRANATDWDMVGDVIECITELIGMDANADAAAATQMSYCAILAESFSCLSRIPASQQRHAVRIQKLLLQMCRHVYPMRDSDQCDKCRNILHFMMHIIQHAKDVALVNRAMVLLCEVVALKTTEALKVEYAALVRVVTERILDDRKTVRNMALKALQILIPLNPFVKRLLVEQIERASQGLDEQIAALVEPLLRSGYSRVHVDEALDALAERIKVNPEENEHWDSLEGLQVMLENGEDSPPQRSSSPRLVALHQKFREYSLIVEFLHASQFALHDSVTLLSIMAQDSSLMDKKCLAIIEEMLTDEACFGALQPNWHILGECVQNTDPVMQATACSIILQRCLPESKGVNWQVFQALYEENTVEDLSQLSTRLVQHLHNSAQRICILRTIASVFDDHSTLTAVPFHVQLCFLLLFHEVISPDYLSRVLVWLKTPGGGESDSAEQLHMVCTLLSVLLKRCSTGGEAIHHKELLQLVQQRFSTLIVHNFSVNLMVQCFQFSLVPLYESFLQIEQSIVNKQADDDSQLSNMSTLLRAVHVLLRVCRECWRIQSEKQWHEKNLAKARDEMEDVEMEHGSGTDNSSDDYLRAHRQKLSKDMFVSEYVQDMLSKSFVTRYIALVDSVCTSRELRGCLCSQDVNVGIATQIVVLDALQVAATCAEISPQHAETFVEHLYRFFLCGVEQENDDAMADDVLSNPQEESLPHVESVRLMAFQHLCSLMRHVPNLVEDKIEHIFDHIQTLVSDSKMRECIILLIGQLCIDKMFRSQRMVFHIAHFLHDADEEMQQVARSFLKRFLFSSGEENAPEQALAIVLKTIQSEEEGMNVLTDIGDISTFLLSECLKSKDKESYIQKLLEEFIVRPTVVLSELVSLHIPSQDEKSSQALSEFVSTRGLYFFKRLREDNSNMRTTQAIFNNLKACLERASKKFKNMAGNVDLLVRVYRHSETWQGDGEDGILDEDSSSDAEEVGGMVETEDNTHAKRTKEASSRHEEEQIDEDSSSEGEIKEMIM